MSNSYYIRAAIIIGIIGVILIILFIIYDMNRGRLIRKRLREDYGEECCRRLSSRDAERLDSRKDYSEPRKRKSKKGTTS